jgi:hypothetical protein
MSISHGQKQCKNETSLTCNIIPGEIMNYENHLTTGIVNSVN